MSGTLSGSDDDAGDEVQVFVNGISVAPAREGFAWSIAADVERISSETPLYGGYSVHVGKVNIVVIARCKGGVTGEVLSVDS
jgi:enoyl-[acyl-carrier-protein] reductase (NADH)